MRNIEIPENLFISLIKYHLFEIEVDDNAIKPALKTIWDELENESTQQNSLFE